MAFRLRIRDSVKRFGNNLQSNPPTFYLDELADLVQDLWRQTPFNTTDITWSWIFRTHFGSSHFLFERAYGFLAHELFWFCLVQVSTTQVCCFPPVCMAPIDDASDRPVPPSPVQLSSSNFGSPNGSGPDIDGSATRPRAVSCPLELDVSNGITRYNYTWRICGSTCTHVQVRNKCSFRLKCLQPRQDLGPRLDRLTAPQPQGPMTQGHLKKAGIQDADLIPSQVQMMEMLEVPFFYGFLANNAMQACPLGSKRHLQQPICLCSTRV